MLELVALGFKGLSKLLDDAVLLCVVGVARKVVGDVEITLLYYPPSILARGRITLL